MLPQKLVAVMLSPSCDTSPLWQSLLKKMEYRCAEPDHPVVSEMSCSQCV